MKTIAILGDIIGGEGERWVSSEVSPKNVIDALAEANGEPVEININSYGGSVLGGIAIANAIKKYPGETTCNVLGIAASMASVIACAGKKTCMGQGAYLMIHNPWTYTSGTAEDLRKDAEKLDQMRDSIISFYKGKCTKTEDEIKALMDAETWISRESAADFGFEVEDYVGEFKAAASLTRRAYDKAPDAVKALVKFMAEKPEDKHVAEAAEKPAEAAAEETATETATEAGKPAEAQETATETVEAEKPVEEAPATVEEPKNEKPADNWEARFKGLSTKFNEAKAEHEKALAARDAEITNLKSQLETQTKDLADATAKVSELSARIEEDAKALQTAQADLAEARDSLTKAEDKAKQLEDTRDMLTAGVLTPPVASSYADKMKAAKTPEEREALRAQKRAGKIN